MYKSLERNFLSSFVQGLTFNKHAIVPRKMFNPMKNVSSLDTAFDIIVGSIVVITVYKVWRESVVQVRRSCPKDALVCSYNVIVVVYYNQVPIERLAKYSTILFQYYSIAYRLNEIN